MKIQYLGTAAAEGYPGIFCNCRYCDAARKLGHKNIRTRSQAILDDTLLIDFPAESYSHILQYGISLSRIHSILITHTHQDHFYPEDLGLRCNGFSHDQDGLLTIYGNDAVVRRFDSMYGKPGDHHLDGLLACRELTEFQTVTIEGYQVTPLLARHDPGEKCFLYYIEKEGTALLYGNDTGYFPEATWAFLNQKPLQLISLYCTLMKYTEGTNHMGLPDNIKVCQILADKGCILSSTKIVLTHFSHNGHMLHEDISAMAQKYGFIAAYDGMSLTF